MAMDRRVSRSPISEELTLSPSSKNSPLGSYPPPLTSRTFPSVNIFVTVISF